MMREVHDIINSTQQLRIRESRMLVQIILLKRGNMYKMLMLQHTNENDTAQERHGFPLHARSCLPRRPTPRIWTLNASGASAHEVCGDRAFDRAREVSHHQRALFLPEPNSALVRHK